MMMAVSGGGVRSSPPSSSRPSSAQYPSARMSAPPRYSSASSSHYYLLRPYNYWSSLLLVLVLLLVISDRQQAVRAYLNRDFFKACDADLVRTRQELYALKTGDGANQYLTLYNLANRTQCAGRVPHPLVPGREALGWVPCDSGKKVEVRLNNPSTAQSYKADAFVGCFWHRLLNDFALIDAPYNVPRKDLKACAAFAKSKGYDVYGLSAGSCWAGHNLEYAMRFGKVDQSRFPKECTMEQDSSNSILLYTAKDVVSSARLPPGLSRQYLSYGDRWDTLSGSGLMTNYLNDTNIYYRMQIKGTDETVILAAYRKIDYTLYLLPDAKQSNSSILLQGDRHFSADYQYVFNLVSKSSLEKGEYTAPASGRFSSAVRDQMCGWPTDPNAQRTTSAVSPDVVYFSQLMRLVASSDTVDRYRIVFYLGYFQNTLRADFGPIGKVIQCIPEQGTEAKQYCITVSSLSCQAGFRQRTVALDRYWGSTDDQPDLVSGNFFANPDPIQEITRLKWIEFGSNGLGQMVPFVDSAISSLSIAQMSTVEGSRYRFFGDFACGCAHQAQTNVQGECSAFQDYCGTVVDTCGNNSSCLSSSTRYGYDCLCDLGFNYDNVNLRKKRDGSDVDPVSNKELNHCKITIHTILVRNSGFDISIGLPQQTVNYSVEFVETNLLGPKTNVTLASGVMGSFFMDPATKAGHSYSVRVAEMAHLSDATEFQITIPCGCSSPPINAETPEPRRDDGRPLPTYLMQKYGDIYVSWVDDSLCSTRFSFHRIRIDENFPHFDNYLDLSDYITRRVVAGEMYAEALVTDFLLERTRCGTKYEPREPFDSLHIRSPKMLNVGERFHYCMSSSNPDLRYRSAMACFPSFSLVPYSVGPVCNEISWEAMFTVKATVGRYVSVAPASQVSLQWSAYVRVISQDGNETIVRVGQGSGMTNQLGEASVHMLRPTCTLSSDVRAVLLSRPTPPLLFTLTFAKRDEYLEHEFECHSPLRACTSADPLQVWVNHGSFGEVSVEVKDITAVDVSGQVTTLGTEDADHAPQGCPVVGAKVCIRSSPGGPSSLEFGCAETNSEGRYSIAVTKKAKVVVSVSYMGHSFRPMRFANSSATAFSSRKSGDANVLETAMIDIGQSAVSGVDFKDVSMGTLVVDVWGGLCELPVLDSLAVTLRKERDGCSGASWTQHLLQYNATRFYAMVPATTFEVTVSSDAFTKTVDALPQSKSNLVSYIERVYAGDRQQRVNLTDLSKDAPPGGVNSTSPLPVTDASKTGYLSRTASFVYRAPKVNLEVEFYDRDGNGSTRVDVPVSPTAKCASSDTRVLDMRFLTTPERSVIIDIVAAEQYFQNSICRRVDGSVKMINALGTAASEEQEAKFAISLDSSQGPIGRIVFMALPSPNAQTKPFTRSVMFQYRDSTGELSKDAMTITILVLGHVANFQGGQVRSVRVSGDPFAIVYKPPGSLSKATYKNIDTEIVTRVAEHEEYTGDSTDATFGVGAEISIEFCVGFVAEVCDTTLYTDTTVSGGFSFDSRSLVESKSGTRSSTLKRTLTWSLEISSQNAIPQSETDVFLVPTDVLYFIPTYNIKQDPANPCLGIREEITTFVSEAKIQPDETTYGVSFFTRQYIRDEVITELQAKSEDPASSPDVKAKLKAALVNWQGLLDRQPSLDHSIPGEFEVLDQAKIKATDKLNLATAYEYSEAKLAASTMPLQPRHASLWNHSTTDMQAKATKSNLISFNGGGPLVTYELADVNSQESLSYDSAEKSRTSLIQIFKNKVVLLSFKAANIEETHKHYNDLSETTTLKAGMEKTSSVSFSLGDAVIGNHFSVRVYRDKSFGTFYFRTVDGKSRCPHEPGTVPREAPLLDILPVGTDDTGRIVPSSRAAIFHLLISNEAEEKASYELSVKSAGLTAGGKLDGRYRSDDVKILFDGTDLSAMPRSLGALEPQTSYEAVLHVHRGSTLFNYDIELVLKSICDKSKSSSHTIHVAFAEPCPAISFLGELGQGSREVAVLASSEPKLSIGVQNEDTSGRLWTQNPVVQQVRIEFYSGSGEWFPVEPGADLRALEDKQFRTAFTDLDLSKVSDRVIKLRATVICVNNLQSHSESSTLRIDRVPPRLLRSSPAYPVPAQDEIVLEFSESIRCGPPLPMEVLLEVVDIKPVNTVYDTFSNLHLACSGNRLSLLPTTPARWLLGKRASLTVRNVKDLAGNLVEPNNAALVTKGLIQLPVYFANLSLTTFVENLEMLQVTTETACQDAASLVTRLAGAIKVKPATLKLERHVFIAGDAFTSSHCLVSFQADPDINVIDPLKQLVQDSKSGFRFAPGYSEEFIDVVLPEVSASSFEHSISSLEQKAQRILKLVESRRVTLIQKAVQWQTTNQNQLTDDANKRLRSVLKEALGDDD